MRAKNASFEAASAEKTESLGAKLADSLKGQNIFLFGDLGLGKTTFIRGLAKGLGVKEKIKSPTFIYEKVYPLPARCHSGRALSQRRKIRNLALASNKFFAHLDLYRVERLSPELKDRLTGLFCDSQATIAIEWSERLPKKMLPRKRVEIHLKELKNGQRKISLYTHLPVVQTPPKR